jgi:hypothetical protein
MKVTMENGNSKVTVGLCVYNGEQHGLRRSIESILRQDHRNLELIISDNASNDGTPVICREFAQKDTRVRYVRNETNLGARKNSYRVLNMCTTEYFKWAEHGDCHEPAYISSCLRKMQEDPSIVLCYPRTRAINENGTMEIANDRIDAMDDSPVNRYLRVISDLCYCNAIYGLYRTSVARSLKIYETECRGPDVVMLAEIALAGKIAQLDEVLYVTYRDSKWSQNIEEQTRRLNEMLDPARSRQGITFPFCNMIREHLDRVRFADLSETDKVFLAGQTLKILGSKYYPRMRDEIKRAIELIHQHRLDHNWGDPTDGSVCRLDPKKQAMYYYYCAEILKRFEEVICVCPQFDEPGLHYARSICLTTMGRFNEAVTALRMELARFPGYERAQRQLSAIEQVLAR